MAATEAPPAARAPAWLAYAQLVRLPNAASLWADTLLATLAAGTWAQSPVVGGLAMLSSTGFYLGGMALNDYCDRAEDAAARPFRPIPSGRIAPRTALALAVGLLALGLACAGAISLLHPPSAGAPVWLLAAILCGTIVAYDAVLKHTPLGPVAMGACRALNVAMVLATTGALPTPVAVHLASVGGVYIAGVTVIAKREEGVSSRRGLWVGAVLMLVAVIAVVLLPLHDPEGYGTTPYPYLVAAWAAWVFAPLAGAISAPHRPAAVQAAVKRGILGLVPLDAILATAFAGPAGLLLVLLLPPAQRLGRRVYST